MTIFPTEILLATDGSEDATLAAQLALGIAAKTGSELHIVYARGVPVYIGPGSEVPRAAHGATEETVRREAKGFLNIQAEQLEAAGHKGRERMSGWAGPSRRLSSWQTRYAPGWW